MAVLTVPILVNNQNNIKIAFNWPKCAQKITELCQKSAKPADTTAFVDQIAQKITDHVKREMAGSQMPTDACIHALIMATLADQRPTIAHDYEDWYRAEQRWQQATDPTHAIQRLTNHDAQVVHENANKDSQVFSTQRDLTAGAAARALGLQMLPPAVAEAHLAGDLHWHDLDYQPYSPMTNCCLIDFEQLLAYGYHAGNATVAAAQSIEDAVHDMVQIIFSVTAHQYGGCSADRVDELLAPYAAKNYDQHIAQAQRWITDPEQQVVYAREQTIADIQSAMRYLEYQINTLYSAQGQTPFTTIGFGLGMSWFERAIQQAILDVRLAGIGPEKRTAIFPKLVFTLKDGCNLKPSDPNYDMKQLALACATQRMYPDVLMYDKIKALTGSFKVPMGCRSFLHGWWDADGKEVNAGRMNLGVVTLNLPRLALRSAGDHQVFWQLFDEALATCYEALAYRLARVKTATPANAPILYKEGVFGGKLDDGDAVDQLFNRSRATISLGYIGLYEVATVFYGPTWENNPAAKDFTLAVVKYLWQHCQDWEAQDGYHYSVYSTPSESLTDRFCRLDWERFGDVPDVTDKEYYTNSFHYDIRKKITPFDKIAFEAPYPQYCSGGFIHYCEYPDLKKNPKALEAVWDYAYDKIGYLGTNTPIDQCFACGFKGEFTPTARGFSCPECHNTDPETCDVVKRTCGYLGNPQQRPMIHGRHQEITARVKHMTVGNDQQAYRGGGQ